MLRRWSIGSRGLWINVKNNRMVLCMEKEDCGLAEECDNFENDTYKCENCIHNARNESADWFKEKE